MEDELYKEVYRMLRQTGNNKVPQRGTYTDEDVVLTYLWAVLHDRPTYWACKKKQLANLVSKKALSDCIDNVTQVTHGIGTRTYAAT